MIPPTVEIRDRARRRVATLDTYDEIELISNLNAPGAWTLRLPGNSDVADLIVENAPGDRGAPGIVVSREGRCLFNGPWLQVITTDDEDGLTKEVAGTDDLGRLAGRWCAPAPGLGYDDHHDVAEETIRHFVAFNAVLNDAPDNRVIDGLRLGPYGALGSQVGRRVRYDPLLEVLQEFAAPDGLRFWIDQPLDDVDDAIYFHVAGLRDQRELIQFSRERGTLSVVKSGSTAPDGNSIIAAGAGEAEAQVTRQRDDADSITRWGLWERRVDLRQSSDEAELDTKLAEAISANAGGFSFEVTPADDVLEWGRHYLLGDMVSVMVAGIRFDGVITRIRCKGTTAGWTVTPTVSTAQTALALAGMRMTSLGTRIGQLERFAANSSVGELKLWGRSDVIPTGWQIADGTMGTVNTIGRALVGVNPSNPIMDTIGELFGAATQLIDLSDAIAAHTHVIPEHTHGFDVDHGHTARGEAVGTPGTNLTGEPDDLDANRQSGASNNPSTTHHHPVYIDSLDAAERTTRESDEGETGEAGGGTVEVSATVTLYQPSVALHVLQRVS